MVKKAVKKKSTGSKKTVKRKTTKKIAIRSPKIPKDDDKLGKILIENFVGLQKVMVNLSVKFEDLSNKISKLLELFEISAKSLAEKDLTIEKGSRDDTRIIQELNNLSDQNKVIARGLTLMHRKLSGEPEEPPEERPPQMPFPVPPKSPFIQKSMPGQEERPMQDNNSMTGYQKSIASPKPTFKKPTQ